MRLLVNKTITDEQMKFIDYLADGHSWGLITRDCWITDDRLWDVNTAIRMNHTAEKANKLSYKIMRTAIRYARKYNIKWLRANRKTCLSVEGANYCDKGCTYCYVNNPVLQRQILRNGKWEVTPDDLTPEAEQGFIKFLGKFKELSPKGFIRFFSFCDCMENQVEIFQRVAELCNEAGVPSVVITKEPLAVPALYGLATKVIYSVDSGKYNSPSSFTQYAEFLEKYPDLRLFYMVADFEELRDAMYKIRKADIPAENVQYVAYHGQIQDTPTRKTPVKAPYMMKPMLLQLLTNRACCTSNRCISCLLRCGLNEKYNPDMKYTVIKPTTGGD